MISLLYDLTIRNNDYLVCVLNGFKPVCYDKQCLVSAKLRYCLLYCPFIISIHAGRCFIEYYYGSIFQDTSCDGYPLFFSFGQRRSSLSDHGIKAIRHLHDKVITPGFFCRFFYFLSRCFGTSYDDIVLKLNFRNRAKKYEPAALRSQPVE